MTIETGVLAFAAFLAAFAAGLWRLFAWFRGEVRLVVREELALHTAQEETRLAAIETAMEDLRQRAAFSPD